MTMLMTLRYRVPQPSRRPLRMHRCDKCGNMVMTSVNAPLHVLALYQLAQDIAGCHADCWRFFELLFPADPKWIGVRSLVKGIGIPEQTLTTRFARARLPSPKRYISLALFAAAAARLERDDRSAADVALEMGFSHQHAFYRMLRQQFGCGANDFRRLDGRAVLTQFREKLVIPYADRLRTFHPFVGIATRCRSQGRLL